MLTQLTDGLKESIKNQSATLLKLVGVDLLSEAGTEALLHNYQIFYNKESLITLNRIEDILLPSKVLFEQKSEITASAYVWRYANADQKAQLLRCGSLMIGDKVVNTDFGNSAALRDFLTYRRRSNQHASVLIAPWSHYWASGYFDFLIYIGAKLCRIKDALPPPLFQEAIVSYPLLNTAFEREFLELLGIHTAQIFDSRSHAITFDECVVGNNGNWFYPAISDLLSLKKHIEARLLTPTHKGQRVYISRAGRRRIINEDALIAMLQTYNFDIIDDKPRTIREQFAIYSNASFVIGPHGASFANMLWCQPGTHLFELFPNDYMPEYFRYLAHLLGLRYSAYCYGPVVDSHHTNVEKDITVSVSEIEQRLNRIFEGKLL